MIDRRGAAHLGLAALAAPLAARFAIPYPARAQGGWPDRTVRLVVPFGAGGAIDTLSRTVASAFPAYANNVSMVVENRAGGGGTIGGGVVAAARPDGGTLMMADLGANAIAQELMRGLTYDPRTAFAPICHIANLPLVLLVPAASTARTAADLLTMARHGPEMLYANPGNGYVGHLAQELMLREAGAKMTPVVYRSGAEVVRSLLANETSSSIITVSTSLPYVREGKLRALAVCARERVRAMPDVPTLAETLPGFEATVWHGIVGPAGLPAEIVDAANTICNALLRDPSVRQTIEERQAGTPVGGSASSFGGFIEAEIARWTPVIRNAGIRAE